MDTSGFTIEDLLADASFLQYCLGTDPAAVAYWTRWVEEHPRHKATVEKARELYFFLNGGTTAAQFEADREYFLQQWKQRRQAPEVFVPLGGSGMRRRPRRRVWAAMAVLLLLAGGALLWHYRPAFRNAPAAKATVYHAKAGERKQLRLPDGSAILLNGGSTITVAADFNQRSRNVYLSGEAYFEVAPDAGQPFMVHTPAILIKVLGTTFNVKAYPEDTVTETALLEGAIQVYASSSAGRSGLPENGVLLSSRRKLQVANPEAKAGLPSATRLQASRYRVIPLTGDTALNKPLETDWTRGRLTFNDQPFDIIARELERWYGVKIRFEDAQLKQYRFVATFDKESIDQVLRALQATSSFHYRRLQDTIILY